MMFTFKWTIFGYLTASLCCCSAALNGTTSRNDEGFKNESEPSPELEYYPLGPRVNCSFL